MNDLTLILMRISFRIRSSHPSQRLRRSSFWAAFD